MIIYGQSHHYLSVLPIIYSKLDNNYRICFLLSRQIIFERIIDNYLPQFPSTDHLPSIKTYHKMYASKSLKYWIECHRHPKPEPIAPKRSIVPYTRMYLSILSVLKMLNRSVEYPLRMIINLLQSLTIPYIDQIRPNDYHYTIL